MGNEKLRKVNNLPFCNYWKEMIKKERKRQEGLPGWFVVSGFRFGDKGKK